MSQATATADHIPTEARAQAAVASIGPWAWARANLFGSWWSTAVTLALGYLIVRALISLFAWGIVNAVWTVPYSNTGIADTAF
jgi:general L-amino acid transport system permease protein